MIVIRDAAARRWLSFAAPRQILVASRLDEVIPALQRVEAASKAGVWAAGFVAYEAGPAFDPALEVRPDGSFPLVWFGLFDAPAVADVPPLPGVVASAKAAWTPEVSEAAYCAALERIREDIRAGQTYQVNHTFRIRAPVDGAACDALVQQIVAQEAPYAAWIDTGDWVLASASPELFFRLEGTTIESRPMKGTAARGLTLDQDMARAEALRASEKERAENVMIVDMVRNDLGRVARDGTVQVAGLFDIERYPTVLQMTSTVAAQTEAGLVDLFRALFPPASITGAPKVETMRIIAGLEVSPRRVYTGAIGYAAPGRRMQFSVAIRTVLVDRRRGMAEYGVGSGIVWDSEPGREWAECATKARVLAPARPEFELLETLRWSPDEGFALLERHLRRLSDSAAYFGFPADLASVRARLRQAAAAFPPGMRRVRLRVGRGGAIELESAPLALPDPTGDGRPRVAVARHPVDAGDPFLYHKTTRRQLYEAARAERPDCADVLLTNTRGEITESTIANVAVERSGRIVTPPVSCGLLAGVERAERLARGDLVEQVITDDDLRRADRVWLLNSVRGMWEVEVVRP